MTRPEFEFTIKIDDMETLKGFVSSLTSRATKIIGAGRCDVCGRWRDLTTVCLGRVCAECV